MCIYVRMARARSPCVCVCVCMSCRMQVEKAPLESYADVGGLEQQIQEIKEVGTIA